MLHASSMRARRIDAAGYGRLYNTLACPMVLPLCPKGPNQNSEKYQSPAAVRPKKASDQLQLLIRRVAPCLP